MVNHLKIHQWDFNLTWYCMLLTAVDIPDCHPVFVDVEGDVMKGSAIL